MSGEWKNESIRIAGKELHIAFLKAYEDRPVLVFLHDSLGCIRLWRDFPGSLGQAARCNVLIYDRLGYGASGPMSPQPRPLDYMEQEATVLHELLIRLNLEKAILFGHSDGGTIALLAASKYPAQVAAVIAEAAHIFVEEITLQGIRNAAAAFRDTNLRLRLQRYHGDKTDTLFKAWADTWTRDDYRQWNIEHFLPGIGCPLLFIQGSADEYGSLQQVERTVGQVSGPAEQYIISGAGHSPHKEVPERVIARVCQFIENLE